MTRPGSLAVVTGRHAFEGRTFDAVLFDMDGTLIDSMAAVFRSWIRWAQERGIDPERLRGLHGVPAAGIVAMFLDDPAERAASVARVEELEVADTADITVLPGTVDALTSLGDACAIATSCTRPLAEARLSATGIPRPGVVVTFDDVTHGKPAPDPYLMAAKLQGADPARCLVVEDAPSGLVSARAAGCTTLAVTTTTPAADLDADLVVDDLSKVDFAVVDGSVRVRA